MTSTWSWRPPPGCWAWLAFLVLVLGAALLCRRCGVLARSAAAAGSDLRGA